MRPGLKKDTTKAMEDLIDQIRLVIPFDTPLEKLCNGPCTGCAKKLLEFLDMELVDCERALKNGEKPGLGDIDKLAKTAKKIFQVLKKNNLIED